MADGCQRDFDLYMRAAWGVQFNPRGRWYDPNRHPNLARFLQTFGLRWLRDRKLGNQRETYLMVVWPRDTAKTVTITKGFPTWLQLHDPDLAVSLGSATAGRSRDFLRAIATVLEGRDRYARFTQYYGMWYDPSLTWREDMMVHARRESLGLSEPSFGTFSVETGATAYHPDVIIIDDPITKEKMRENSNWLQLVNEHMINLIPVLKRGGLFVYVGTPYHDGDAIHTLWRDEGVAKFYGDAPDDGDRYLGGRWHVFYLPGKSRTGVPNFPTIWTPEKMERYEKRSPLDFSAQVLLTPAAGGHMPFQRMHLDTMWMDSTSVPRSWQITVHLDTAFKTPDRVGRGDENVIVVAAHATDGTGRVAFLECLGSNQWHADQCLEQVVEVVHRYRKKGFFIRGITDEEEIGGKAGSWRSQIRNRFVLAGTGMPVVHLIRRQHAGKKVDRLMDVAGHWASGTVRLVKNGPGIERLVSQMLRIGQSRFDDYADAAADAFHEVVYNPAVRETTPEEGTWTMPERPYDDLLKGAGYFDAESSFGFHPQRTREPIR